VIVSDTAEMIVINNKTSRPRSAIGFTNNNLVLLLAVEGDNTVGGYDGVNLLDLSNILASLGCQDAINLDGGGSTSMVFSNQLLVRPGDNGVERPVVSAVLIKKK
jgi:exopolysaccharide biosynthesis protein